MLMTRKKGLHARLFKGLLFLTVFILDMSWKTVACAEPHKKAETFPPARVHVSNVLEKEVVTRITLVGTAEPWLETIVASEVAGLVKEMEVEEGDRVIKDQILCVQDSTQLILKGESAEAELAEAEVMLARARREWERQERLFSINSVSEKAYEDARFESEAAARKVERLRAEVRVLEDRLKKKTIRAPVTGYVVERHSKVGQWLGEGEPVVTLIVINPMRVMVPVPERYVPWIKKGDRAQVTFDALPYRKFEGPITAVIPRADRKTRTFPVRIEIPNPDGIIMAGKLGRATFAAGKPHKAILVPKDSLVLKGARASVFIVDDQSVRVVTVKTGVSYGSLVEVEGDLKAGLKVVVRGNERLIPGQPVQIIRDTSSPDAKAPNGK